MSQPSVDRWIAAWRQRGFGTLLLLPERQVAPRTDPCVKGHEVLLDLLATAETTDPDTCTDGICTIIEPSHP